MWLEYYSTQDLHMDFIKDQNIFVKPLGKACFIPSDALMRFIKSDIKKISPIFHDTGLLMCNKLIIQHYTTLLNIYYILGEKK